MKILLRNFGEETYVWKDAKYNTKGFFVDESFINETNIVSILNDNRKQYIKCPTCGEVFRKGSSKWNKHTEPVTNTDRCFSCKYLRVTNSKVTNVKYTLLPNGKYASLQKGEVNLNCNATWYGQDINSENARESCIYNRCVNAEAQPISDIFTENPEIFDNIITVDQITKNGYKERYYNGGAFTEYKLKCRNQIYAYVNKVNVVDHFIVTYRNNSWTLYYSKKYDKFYTYTHTYEKGNSYVEWNPSSYDITSEAKEYIKKKIASLYN